MWNVDEKEQQPKRFDPLIQKTIIHTLIDALKQYIRNICK